MAAKPALTFDPRYVDLVIQTWQKHDFQPMPPEELASAIEQQANDSFRALNEKGLREEDVSKKEYHGGGARAVEIAQTDETDHGGAKECESR